MSLVGLPYNSDGDACQNIEIKPPSETNVGVAQTKTDPWRKFLFGQCPGIFCKFFLKSPKQYQNGKM